MLLLRMYLYEVLFEIFRAAGAVVVVVVAFVVFQLPVTFWFSVAPFLVGSFSRCDLCETGFERNAHLYYIPFFICSLCVCATDAAKNLCRSKTLLISLVDFSFFYMIRFDMIARWRSMQISIAKGVHHLNQRITIT